jgi:hypothetical protein
MPVKKGGAMAEGQSRGRVLRTWKDVAAHLNCSVRSCRRWEEAYGLPIHRIGSTLRSGIFAYEQELDAWLLKRGDVRNGRKEEIYVSRKYSKRLDIMIVVTVISLAILGGALLLTSRHKAQPADFRFEGNTLIIVDNRGKDLWRYDTQLDNLASDEYRAHFQIKRHGEQGLLLPYLLIGDLNDDGWNEVLFSAQTQLEIGEGELSCIDHLGNRIWHYKSGKEMTYGNKLYSDDYRIRGIDCADLNNDGKLEVIVIAVHRPEWPCQLTVLDCRGRVIGEYWNGGYIADYVFKDLNQDNRVDVILSGVHNEKKTGFLAVLDSTDISGGSPQEEEEFINKDLRSGSEVYYVIVPRTDVDLVKFAVETLDEVVILRNGRISAKTYYTGLYYEFGPDLRALEIKDSHLIQQLHKELLSQGAVSTEYGHSYLSDLKNRILYWTGHSWTNQHIAHNPW